MVTTVTRFGEVDAARLGGAMPILMGMVFSLDGAQSDGGDVLPINDALRPDLP